MSSSSSDTESQSYQSDDSEWNYIPGPYNVEKTSASGEMRDSNSHHEGNVGPYANEPATSYPGSLPTPGASGKTLAAAGHVTPGFWG